NIYIDHKGFKKEWIKRRGDDFRKMSLHICREAGIEVFEVFRDKKSKTAETTIYPATKRTDEPHEKSIPKLHHCESVQSAESFMEFVKKAKAQYDGTNFAMALAYDNEGHCHVLAAEQHLVSGYTEEILEKEDYKGKY